jgi:UDP-4-amino-4,6-dideoxy-L-N-acetyl-beta-L-altrosamine transaminase
MDFLPYGKQWIDQADIQAVTETLQSDFLTTGPKIQEFEQKICDVTGAKYTIAVSNGTAALHLSSLALLEPNDIVLTTPNSFIATSNSILYVKSKPVFVDIQKNGNIDLELCEEIIKKEPNIKAIYIVHFSGNPVDQEMVGYLRETYGVLVVEDCCHSLGAVFRTNDGGFVKAGSCVNSDLSILSFHPVKHITTAEGGAITTNDFELYKKIMSLRNHGMDREVGGFQLKEQAFDSKGNQNPWYYEMHDLGFNYRITDIQAALGVSQLSKLDQFVRRRRTIAENYDAAFSDFDWITPLYPENKNSSYHLYVVLCNFDSIGLSRAECFQKMREKNIGLQVHYIPINKQPYYQSLGYGNEETPIMDKYYSQCLSIPMYPLLSDDQQDFIINSFSEITSD